MTAPFAIHLVPVAGFTGVMAVAAFEDLRSHLERPSVAAARELFPRYSEPIPPFLPHEWLP